MAEPKAFAQKVGLTPGKATVMGVLAVALVGVIYIQYFSGDDEEAATAVFETTSTPPPAPATASPAVPATPQVTTAQAPNPAAQLNIPPVPTFDASAFDETKWKSPELATVVSYDPFALPEAFPHAVRTADMPVTAEDSEAAAAAAANQLAEALDSLQSELKALQERGVQVIIRGRSEYAAMIGDRTVHVGEKINGFTVTAIEPDGVRVERKLSE